MPMKNPPHPGKVVRVSCLEPLGLNVTEGAKSPRRQSPSPLELGELSHPHFGRHGDPSRESLRLYDGDLDTAASGLRCHAGTSARG